MIAPAWLAQPLPEPTTQARFRSSITDRSPSSPILCPAVYKVMKDTLVFLTHLDPTDTERIMLDKLTKQVRRASSIHLSLCVHVSSWRPPPP